MERCIVIDYLGKKLEALLDSVIEPVWTRLLAARWWIKALVLLVGVGVFAAIKFPTEVEDAVLDARMLMRVALAEPGRLPLDRELATKLRGALARLSETIRADLSTVPSDPMTPWSTAQAIEAVGGLPSPATNGARLVAGIRDRATRGCACWSELAAHDTREPACTFVSGWVLAAFADLGVAATPDELDFVLRQQGAEGAWRTFDIIDRPQFASTYSTAWNVIGLVRQRQKNLIASDRIEAVDGAIARGRAWLLGQRQKGRWRPYPGVASVAESESVSGVVLHALHVSADPSDLVALDEAWIDALPSTIHPASDSENYYVEMAGSGGLAIDHFVQLKVPWMLVATNDAFDHGSLWQRAHAMRWIERTLRQESVQNADANASNWWRAELALALRELMARVPADG